VRRFLESKLNGNVIDILGASTKPNAGLDSYPQKASSDGNDNQLWHFLPDPSGSGYFYIVSKLYVKWHSFGRRFARRRFGH
jgi:hypothetical protein